LCAIRSLLRLGLGARKSWVLTERQPAPQPSQPPRYRPCKPEPLTKPETSLALAWETRDLSGRVQAGAAQAVVSHMVRCVSGEVGVANHQLWQVPATYALLAGYHEGVCGQQAGSRQAAGRCGICAASHTVCCVNSWSCSMQAKTKGSARIIQKSAGWACVSGWGPA
jgi:hypothetical protein